MYLKKLYANGFKSIGKPVEIDLMNNVNVIMGPNGSGKSNFFECIQWVLGGMSAKQLRASSMEDVIFDGGSTLKPANVAEATLVFDNSDKELDIDTDEVSITRKLTRGKGTEYFINNKPAKLKDLTNLFMNKGIGKNNYAITGQNRITEFIMMKPEDIRGVIEEAAGISGFRLKKNELITSIANYDRDIERINAVIQEIARSIKPLKRQIKNAEIYETISKELNEKKLFYFSKKSAEINNILDKTKTKLNEHFAEKERLNEEKISIENYLSSYEKTYTTLQNEVSSLENTKTNLETKLNDLSKNKIMQENNLNNLKDKKSRMISNIKRLEESSNVEEKEKNSLFKTINDMSKEISTIKSSIENLDKEISSINNTLKSLDSNILSSKESLTNLTIDIDRKNKDKEIIESEKVRIQSLIEKRKEELDKIKKEIDTLNSSIEQNNDFINIIKDSVSSYKNIESQIKTIENLLNSSKKADTRKKRTLEIKDLLSNVNGFKDVLFNIISYDEKYINAMDTLYGSVLYNFVVDDVKSAEECVSILKKNKIPPANFIIISKIKGSGKSSQDLDDVTRVSDILSYDSKYSNLILDYFSNSFIASDIKVAEKVWNDTSQKYRICTLDGTLFSSNVIRGGFIQKDSKKLKDEYDILLSKKSELLTFNNETFSNIYELKSKINVFQKENEVLLNQISSLKNREESLSKEVSVNKDSLNLAKEKQSNIATSILDIEDEKRKIQLKIDEMESSVCENKDLLSNLKCKRESLFLDSSKKETLIEEYEKKYYVYKNNSKEQIESLKNNIGIVDSQISLLNAQYNESIKSYDSINLELNEINLNWSLKRKELEELRLNKDSNSNKLNDIVKFISNIENLIIKCQYEIESLESNLDSILENKETIPDDTVYVELEEDINSIYSSIQSLEKKIKSLGFINTDAITEYKELNSRYETMTNNKKDLEESKIKILTLLQTIQDDMAIKYMDCYNTLKKDFSDIFTKLFNGGSAELTMENPDAPLESGVVIKATPPGKKNKAISLLSGGEKSLAAVSFIFALLKYSPSPVVIFDEIDAALDEINVSLIADYIKTNNNVQYVIVSHRKPMMKIAKALYGASMNKGVTELISQKF